MRLPHEKKKCKYCGVTFWRLHHCPNNCVNAEVNIFVTENSFRNNKAIKCKRCFKKYLSNPITEDFHKTCKITSGSAKW